MGVADTQLRSKRGLRFDKVAVGLIACVQSALRDDVPDSMTLLFTVTAPIRVPGKTAGELTDRLRVWLQGRNAPAATRYTIRGNAIRVCVVNGRQQREPNVRGFVHNPDVDVKALFDEARESSRKMDLDLH
jgi:hypothetical protein